ncbi:hypothetical protein ACFOWA_03630 [Pedobacter lithocola]|uniref:Outer membrane protein beta-barrel domain-containing protein n=1 Tax=Pedobacter lithocola TaxID=1908239 RepID=A0ABV8P8H9_9SPHI
MDKELIDHIKDNLQAHEEAYTPGAWERFSMPEKKKRRGIVYWPFWSAAAVILVFGGLFFLQKDEIKSDKTVVNQHKAVNKKVENNSTKSSSIIEETPFLQPKTQNLESASLNSKNDNNAVSSSIEKEKTILNTNPLITSDKVETTTISDNASLENILIGKLYTDRIASSSKINDREIVADKKPTEKPKTTFEELLAQDSYANNINKTQKIKGNTKWEPGIFVAPTIGNDNKVNMNYGFSLSYNLATKLSISSGVAYTALSSTSNPNKNDFSAAQNSSSAMALASSYSNRSLQSVDASVRGINIPLELKYNISNKFYTGIGVSALAIINNKQQNNYIVSQAQNATVINTMGYAEQKMQVVTERVSEQQSEAVIAPEKYLGFYNFNFGYKQKISPKKHIAVEPFLRLPMKDFSRDNLNLTNGGIRLKLDF